jgi:hypothetical protein
MAGRRRSPQTHHSGISMPLGVSPDGYLINSVEELPDLPLPKKVIVVGNALRVDGGIFRVRPIGIRTLEWMGRQAWRWQEEDSSPENKAQVFGVFEAIERMMLEKPQAGGAKQGEFEF